MKTEQLKTLEDKYASQNRQLRSALENSAGHSQCDTIMLDSKDAMMTARDRLSAFDAELTRGGQVVLATAIRLVAMDLSKAILNVKRPLTQQGTT